MTTTQIALALVPVGIAVVAIGVAAVLEPRRVRRNRARRGSGGSDGR